MRIRLRRAAHPRALPSPCARRRFLPIAASASELANKCDHPQESQQRLVHRAGTGLPRRVPPNRFTAIRAIKSVISFFSTTFGPFRCTRQSSIAHRVRGCVQTALPSGEVPQFRLTSDERLDRPDELRGYFHGAFSAVKILALSMATTASGPGHC